MRKVVAAALREESAAAEAKRCTLQERFGLLQRQKAEAEVGRYVVVNMLASGFALADTSIPDTRLSYLTV